MLMWILYDAVVAAIINVILALFLLQFCGEGWSIYRRLYVEEKNAVTNKLNLLNG